MKSMKKILIFVILIVSISCNTSSPAKEDLGYQGQSSERLVVEELLFQLKSNPEVQFRVERGWHIAVVKSEHTLYSFTPENHPAHPSYVKRSVVEKDGAIYMETSAKCGAEKDICDQLLRDFIELNHSVKEKVGVQ